MDKLLWERILKITYFVAISSAILMMLLTTADVAGRYLFNNPITGAVEGNTYLQVVLIFLAAAAAQAEGRHISVEILSLRLPPRSKQWLKVFVSLLLLGLGLVMTWKTGEQAYASWQIGEYESPTTTFLPVWPVRAVLTLGCFLLSIEFLRELVSNARFAPHTSASKRD